MNHVTMASGVRQLAVLCVLGLCRLFCVLVMWAVLCVSYVGCVVYWICGLCCVLAMWAVLCCLCGLCCVLAMWQFDNSPRDPASTQPKLGTRKNSGR